MTNTCLLLSQESSRQSLNERLQSLPSELRDYIFALLLVQPVKWEMTHRLRCSLRFTNIDPRPRMTVDLTNDCVRCYHWLYPRGLDTLWEHRTPGWQNPWRSQWAPPVRNPWVCSECWDENFRPRPFPSTARLRCLCARRENLQVLLVCRAWYEEAAHVFWCQNMFAFEDCKSFTDFVDCISPRWRKAITRVSVMAYRPTSADGDMKAREIIAGCEKRKKLNPIWQRLRRLPSLAYLELDARFLTSTTTVQPMLRMGLQSVR